MSNSVRTVGVEWDARVVNRCVGKYLEGDDVGVFRIALE